MYIIYIDIIYIYVCIYCIYYIILDYIYTYM